jgi:hypothetical protein
MASIKGYSNFSDGVVQLILDHDAKVDELDGAQRTPLHYASGEVRNMCKLYKSCLIVVPK